MSTKLAIPTLEEIEALAAMRPSAALSGFGLKLKNWIDENEGKRAFNAVKVKDTLELNMLDVIGEDWWTGGGITSNVVKQALDAHPDVKTIKVLMNSPGGDAWEGIAIRALLARHGARVEFEIIGLCASAATVIAMAGDSVEMHEGTMFMVHRAWTWAVGNALDMGKTVNFLNKIDSNIVDLYESRTGRNRADLQKLVDDETWMTARESVAEKFATGVIPAKAAEEKPKQRAKNDAPLAPKAAATATVQVKVALDTSAVTEALGADDEELEVARAAVAAHRSAKQQAFYANHPQARAAAPLAPPMGGMRSR